MCTVRKILSAPSEPVTAMCMGPSVHLGSPPRSMSLGVPGLNRKTRLTREIREMKVEETPRRAADPPCHRQPACLGVGNSPTLAAPFPSLWPLPPLSLASALCHSPVSDIDVLVAVLLTVILVPRTPDGPCVQDPECMIVLSPSLHREQTRIQEQSTAERTLCCLPLSRPVQTLRQPPPNNSPPH